MKFLATIFTALVVALGFGGNVHATVTPTIPPECAESDTRPDDVDCAVEDGSYPLLLPESGTVPDTTTPPAPTGGLPATGTDSTTLVLQMGGVLLIGGLVVLVAARRRSPATS